MKIDINDPGDIPCDTLTEKLDTLTSALALDNPLPEIGPEIYNRLPPRLRRLCQQTADDTERAVFFTTSLPIIAGHLVNVKVACRDGLISICLFMIVFGVAGAGKGALRLARRLGKFVDDRLYETSQAEIAQWKTQRSKGDATENAPEPKRRGLFASGNTSSAALAAALVNNGGRVVVVEPELNTMAVAGKQDWGGNNANIFLQAFHGEDITGEFKNGSYRITHPVINLSVTATRSAVRGFVPSPENGLLSRFMFFQIDADPVWLSQAPTEQNRERDEEITEVARWLDTVHQHLSSRNDDNPLVVNLTPKQWQRHTLHFTKELARLNDSGAPRSMEASVKRAGINAFRIAATLSVIRCADEMDLRKGLSINTTDDDVTTGIELATIFLRHAVAYAATLPDDCDAASPLTLQQKDWLTRLPAEFKTAEAVAVAGQLEIAERTAKSWLKSLTNGPIEKLAYGVYRKRQSTPLTTSERS